MGRRLARGGRQACVGARGHGRQARMRGARGWGARGAWQGRAGRAACAGRLGQVSALCTWLSSDSVFDLVLTQYCS